MYHPEAMRMMNGRENSGVMAEEPLILGSSVVPCGRG